MRKKRGPGAPKGNMNAVQHFATSKAKARADRDRDRRESKSIVRELLVEKGVQDRFDAKEAGYLYAENRTVLLRILRAAQRAPNKTKSGALTAELSRATEQLTRTSGLLERLLAICAQHATPARRVDDETLYVVRYDNGRLLDDAMTEAPHEDDQATEYSTEPAITQPGPSDAAHDTNPSPASPVADGPRRNQRVTQPESEWMRERN